MKHMSNCMPEGEKTANGVEALCEEMLDENFL